MKVVIFGLGRMASLAWYVLTHDSRDEVTGFTVDADHLDRHELHGLPAVAFEQLEHRFPPDEVALLIPLGWHDVNGLRMRRYLEAKARGYAFTTYISSRAHTWPDLVIGENCMVFEGAIIQPFARVGNNCIIRSGSHVSHHVELSDHSFLAPSAALAGGVTIGERSFIGVNASVRDGVRVAPRCVVAAGAVVITDTIENGIYVGVPAKRRDMAADLLGRL
jgi:sugar O-acyltransferase (sialic acid O-acetyltransferase NeuD family)